MSNSLEMHIKFVDMFLISVLNETKMVVDHVSRFGSNSAQLPYSCHWPGLPSELTHSVYRHQTFTELISICLLWIGERCPGDRSYHRGPYTTAMLICMHVCWQRIIRSNTEPFIDLVMLGMNGKWDDTEIGLLFLFVFFFVGLELFFLHISNLIFPTFRCLLLRKYIINCVLLNWLIGHWRKRYLPLMWSKRWGNLTATIEGKNILFSLMCVYAFF